MERQLSSCGAAAVKWGPAGRTAVRFWVELLRGYGVQIGVLFASSTRLRS
jgi:hypothetical protein